MGLLSFLRRSAFVGILPWWLQHGPRLQPSLPRSRIMAVSPPDFWSFSSWFQFLHSPPFPPKIKKKRNARKFGWNSGRMGLQEYFVGDGFFSIPTCQNPRRKAVVKQPVAPRWSDATNATNATSFTEATTTGEESWILKTYLQLGRLDVHWNYKLRIMKLCGVNLDKSCLRVLWKAMLFSDGCDGQKVVLPHFNVLCVSRCERFEFGDSKGRTWRCSKTGASQRKFRKREDNESGCLD